MKRRLVLASVLLASVIASQAFAGDITGKILFEGRHSSKAGETAHER
jgi:hypothetical protein